MSTSTRSRPRVAQRPDGRDGARRTAALWVAGTGAFLLLVAAGLFVAVRWDEIPEEGKLGAVLGLTGAFLLCGRAMRERLPATGGVLFHLGAFLLPVDLAGINLRLGLGWRELLLAEGLLGTVAFGLLGWSVSSVVLRRAAAVSVVVTAVGLGALTPLPAPVVLAAAAVVLLAVRPGSGYPPAWAVLAGLSPLLVLAAGAVPEVARTISALDLTAAAEPLPGLATGLVAGAVLAACADRRGNVVLAGLAFGVVVVDAGVAWAGADLPMAGDVLVLPAAFLAVQLLALVTRWDPFWGRPAAVIALGAEVLAGLAALYAVPFVLVAPFLDLIPFVARPEWGVALGVAAVAWLGGALRRRWQGPVAEGPWLLAAVPAGVSVVAAVEAGTASPVAVAGAMLAVAAAWLVARRRSLDVGAAVLAVYAPLTAAGHPRVSLLFGALAALLLTVAAGEALRMSSASADRPRALGLAGAAVAALGIGTIFAAGDLGPGTAGAVFVVGCWAMAASSNAVDFPLGQVPRLASLLVLGPALLWDTPDRLLAVVPLVGLLALDAVRLREPVIGYGAAVAVQAAVADLGLAAGLEVPEVGVAMAVAAVVWAGLGVVAGEEWHRPFALAAAIGAGAGLGMASGDPAAFGAALLVVGGLALAAGVLGGHAPPAHLGGAAMTVGLWLELDTGGVVASEAYVLPVALHLLVAGAVARRARAVSSWVAYAPAVAALGASGFVERAGGGSGWHAVVAGGVGVLAVAAGGWRRLAGPLFVGTGLLVGVTVFESLAVIATVPTWAWLGLGGSTLLAAGVAMERADTSPVEAGRRVVDVVGARFE